MLQILLFGSTGLLGWYIKTYLSDFYEVVCITRDEFDILKDDTEQLSELLERKYKGVEVIINCTNAYTAPIKEQLRVHTYFPVQLSKICHSLNIHLIQISTNGVFSGEKGGYRAVDRPNALDIYGRTKTLGEHLPAIIIRASIIGESTTNKKCLIEWLRAKAKANAEAKDEPQTIIDGFNNCYWNGITCLTLAKYIHQHFLIPELFVPGIYHLASKDTISKYELIQKINSIYHFGLVIRPKACDTPSYFTLHSDTMCPDIDRQIIEQKVFTKIHRKPKGSYVEKTQCRFCDTKTIDSIHLGNHFGLAGGFIASSEIATEDKVYPLSLAMCPKCCAIQCKQVVSADELFKKNYYYYSSMIPSLVSHFKELAERIAERWPVVATPTPIPIKILEMGCNDGVLLHPLKQLGYTYLIGVDPSRTIQQVDPSIYTYNDYFNDTTTEKILAEHSQVDIFVACNSFAHIDDMKTILTNLKRVLRKDTGEAIIEVHYSKNIFTQKQFDFIYHEHMSYYTVTSIYNICRLYGMHLLNVECIPNHGGSIRCILQNKPAPDLPSATIQEFLKAEASLFDPGFVATYTRELYTWRENFIDIYYSFKKDKKRVYGYGASGRANTLLNFCTIELDAILDDAPSKIGLYTPMLNTPIVNSTCLLELETSPDYIVVLAWPYAEFIIKKQATYKGTFIIPLPEISLRRNTL